MKKILVLLIFFTISYCKAKTYEFDTLIQYTTSIDNKKATNSVAKYSNSKDDSYFLSLYRTVSDFEARLFDYKNEMIYTFDVIETKTNEGITFKFDYRRSDPFYFRDLHSNNVFTFETLESNDSIKKVKLNVYKNAKKKKLILYYDLEIKESKKNLFPSFRISSIHQYEFNRKLNLENCIVLKAVGTTVTGQKIENKLLEYKEASFTLDVPK